MEYVSYGECQAGVPGSKQDIVGVNFTLSPMSDSFVDIILGAVGQVDLSNVWAETSHVGTTYRGEKKAVFDALAACTLHAYQEGTHMSLHATISQGCPGDVDRDYKAPESESKRVNASNVADIHFDVLGRFSLYPLGQADYMSVIADVVNQGIDCGVIKESAHYGTVLSGDVHEVFRYLEEISAAVHERVSHYVIELTLHMNIPGGDIDE
ncbi:YkoF family thiamine/hydroxymethylpyrimidine-binding protein [Dolosigranulum savutiense]|uniref:YkoF family thiamine/hydroxymethylpyrimidine-binding protein n=1 Tax=Dolosigranulum savutiense TaxID=3110288 RepID=A0AB74U0X2_9LACT